MALDLVFREHWGRVLATLVGVLGDIEIAEDAAQEAFARSESSSHRPNRRLLALASIGAAAARRRFTIDDEKERLNDCSLQYTALIVNSKPKFGHAVLPTPSPQP